MADFHIKQNDRKEPFNATLKDSSGVAVDLTGATVLFRLRQFGAAAAKVNASAAIISAAAGTVRYSWASGDTDSPGEYEAEFQVTFSDGTIQTFPNAGVLSVLIHPEVA